MPRDHPVDTPVDAPVDTSGIRCAEAVELVTLHLDDALGGRDRRLFERHVDGCVGCARFVAQIRHTIRLTRRVLEQEGVTPQPRIHELREAFVARRPRPT